MSGDPAPEHAHGLAPGLDEAAAAVRRESRRRRLRTGCLVSIFTLALCTLAAEVALRATGDRERAFAEGVNRTNRRWVALMTAGVFEEVDDPVRRYAMRPGASTEVDGWRFRVSVHRSRGPDFPSAKPAGEKRMLLLGDSFAFGMWCDEDATLVGHLARMASAREAELGTGVAWRPVDLGVPGYHTGQQLLALEQDGLALEPDVVVLYFNTNDIAREGFFFDEELGLRNDHLPLPTALRRLLWESHLYGFIVRQHYLALKEVPAAAFDPRVPWAHVRADNQAATREALAQIARVCRERGIALFLVNQPLWTWCGAARDPEWPVRPLVGWVEGIRDELAIPGLDLLGLLSGYSDGVDRVAATPPGEAPPPPDFLPDAYVADEDVQRAFAEARALARGEGRDWERLSVAEQMALVARVPAEVPLEPDFHLTGEGYGHIARLCYPRMQAAGMVP
jgi:lysophospholipase L1-like esterase